MYKKTSIHDRHIAADGKMVEFAGFELPIQYSSIVKEHTMVREKCGLFDVSHMGEIEISGNKAEELVQYIATIDIGDMTEGDVKYSPMCYESGGCVDDILIYKYIDKFLLVVNASNTIKDLEWINKNNIFGAQVEDISHQLSQIAIQGPLSRNILSKVINENELPQKYYTFVEILFKDQSKCIVSRTGYTGEDGYELYMDNKNAPVMWDELLINGGDDIAPCGLGARDTLRLEAGMPLYGHELSPDITPLEAGLKRFVSLEKNSDFLGKKALNKQAEDGLTRRKCSIKLIDKGIGREGNLVFINDMRTGYLTSGTKSITLGKSIGLAMVNVPYNKIGTEIQIQIRNKMMDAIIVKGPFYKRQK